MFSRSAIAESVTRVCPGSVATVSRIADGQNHSYRVALADGRERLLKVGTRYPDRFPAEPRTQAFVRRETAVPVPQVYGTGREPVGYPFAVYDFVEDTGDGWTRELPPATADRLCREAGRNLAELHRLSLDQFGAVDVEEGALTVVEPRAYRDLLRDSVDRQVADLADSPFASRLDQVAARGAELVERVAVDAVQPTLVHGDYRIDNLRLAPSADRVTAAVLDWELPTAGDPLWDVVMTLAVLTDGYGIDPARRRSLRTAFREGYGPLATDSARWRCYELLARLRLARHVETEMRGTSAAATSTRIDEHLAAFEALLDGGTTLRPAET